MSIIKSLFTDDNKINEGNIILFFALLLLGIDEGLVWFNGLTWIEVAYITIHMLFIFLMCKTENSKLDANEVVKAAVEVLKSKKV